MNKPTALFAAIASFVLIMLSAWMIVQQLQINQINEALSLTADTLVAQNKSIGGLAACVKLLSK